MNKQITLTIRWTNPTDEETLAKVIEHTGTDFLKGKKIVSLNWMFPATEMPIAERIVYTGIDAMSKVISDGCTGFEIVYEP